MAPEMHGEAMYDYKADLFSTGIVLTQILTGVHPFFTLGIGTLRLPSKRFSPIT